MRKPPIRTSTASVFLSCTCFREAGLGIADLRGFASRTLTTVSSPLQSMCRSSGSEVSTVVGRGKAGSVDARDGAVDPAAMTSVRTRSGLRDELVAEAGGEEKVAEARQATRRTSTGTDLRNAAVPCAGEWLSSAGRMPWLIVCAAPAGMEW
jgi:hypothetical protein